MATIYRIKNLDNNCYWNGKTWGKTTGKIYSTEKLANKTLTSGILAFKQRIEPLNLKVVEATIIDKE